MAGPAIVWRNPNVVVRRRIWNQARCDATSSLYIVVQSTSGEPTEWEGLPNLEVIRGGAATRANKRVNQPTRSRV